MNFAIAVRRNVGIWAFRMAARSRRSVGKQCGMVQAERGGNKTTKNGGAWDGRVREPL